MCVSMADIRSPAADIKRGKKERRSKKKPHDENIMSVTATQGGHNNVKYGEQCKDAATKLT